MKGFSARRGINPILMLRSPLHVGRLTRHIRRPYLCNGLQADAKTKHNPPNIVKGTGSIDVKLKVYKSQLYTIPNMITISRMCCSPLLTLAIINDEKMIALGGCCVLPKKGLHHIAHICVTWCCRTIACPCMLPCHLHPSP